MSDDLSQLDELIESDVLEALGQSPAETQDISDAGTLDDEIDENFAANDPKDMLGSEAEAFFDAQLNGEGDADVQEDIQQEQMRTQAVSISGSDIGSMAAMLEGLLKNKTIEITIKVKD